MRRLHRAVVIALLIAPFLLILLAGGLVFLWENPWLATWLWIPIPICWGAAFWFYRWGRKRFGAIWQPETSIALHWTDRDRAAWQRVVERADQSGDIPPDELWHGEHYFQVTRDLATDLAVFYHPEATDPLESLTVPEILTAIELAVSDIRHFLDQNVPGSHLMTVRWLKRAPRITETWSRLRPIYYAASALWKPWSVFSRLAADGTVVTPVMDEFKLDGLRSLHRIFILQTGKYLIELNSHRLKVGPERWRAWRHPAGPSTADSEQQADESVDTSEATASAPLKIAVVGQVKAGKSSLINALVGRQQAAVDVLPLAPHVDQYRVQPAGAGACLVMLDTAGYGHQGARADHLDQTMRQVCDASMTILVLHACQPAREPDRKFLSQMEAWYAERPKYRRPPVLAVLSHIDGLPPPLEWSPPYDHWPSARQRDEKEQNIRAVVDDVQALFGSAVDGVVPACTDVINDRTYGVEEWVVPAMLNLLPQAQAKRLVDAVYAEADQARLAQLMRQLWHASSSLAKFHFCGPAFLMPDAPDPQEQRDS